MKILIIGDSCQDVFVYGKADRLCPEAPVPVFIPQRKISNGGMAANVFENIKSLNFSADIITNEIQVEKIRYVEEKTNHQIIRIDTEYEKTKRIKDLNKIDFSKYEAVIISDYNKGFLEYDDIEYICKAHSTVFIDTKKVINEKMSLAKFIKINEYEYKNNILAGQNFDKFKNKLIVTLSGRGCLYLEKIYPVELVEIKDNSGAGDTFISGLVVNYCKTKDIEDSIKFANECATVVVQQKGVNRVGDFLTSKSNQ